jgi:hypothetical protein
MSKCLRLLECKYHDKYVELIKLGDRDGIEELLTNRAVEEKLLQRLRKKAEVYGREIEDGDESPPPSSSPILGSAASHSILPDKKVPGLRLPVDVGKQKKSITILYKMHMFAIATFINISLKEWHNY